MSICYYKLLRTHLYFEFKIYLISNQKLMKKSTANENRNEKDIALQKEKECGMITLYARYCDK